MVTCMGSLLGGTSVLGENICSRCAGGAGDERTDCVIWVSLSSCWQHSPALGGATGELPVRMKCHRSTDSTHGVRTRRCKVIFAHGTAGHGRGPARGSLCLLKAAGMSAWLSPVAIHGPGHPGPLRPRFGSQPCVGHQSSTYFLQLRLRTCREGLPTAVDARGAAGGVADLVASRLV